jgi:hypothetical protein
LPEVLNTQGTSCTNFKASVPDSIKQKLQSSLGLDLSSVSDVPFRWIHGDTKPHVDRGQRSFENTYLVYLTDGDGEFEVGEESYPITAGTGFVFPEGTSHAVKNTNGTSRLVLGPMSEAGFSVGGGGTTIVADSLTEIVYISQEGSTISYRIGGNGSLNTITFPVYIVNTNPTTSTLQVFFTTDITLTTTDDYFVMNSDGIQFGNPYLKEDGSKYLITIDGVTDYNGLVYSVDRDNISIFNLHVSSNESTISTAGGWIGQAYFGQGALSNYIINCSSDGVISADSGGIVGAQVGSQSGEVIISGCSSSGVITSGGGGIAGSYFGSSGGNVTITNCSSSGYIASSSGGIAGSGAGLQGFCIINKCYSTGVITDYGGGIVANNAGQDGRCDITNSYSRGNISEYAGGICGAGAAAFGGTVNLINCYSTGTVTTEGTGIFGSSSGEGATQLICYVANGTWVDADASALDMNYYQSVGTNQPYELKNFGPNP